MDLIQQRRDLLNLVYDDLGAVAFAVGLDFLAQKLRVHDVTPELVCLQQINPTTVAVVLPEERGLPGLARSPEEERLCPWRWETELSLEHATQNIMIIGSDDSDYHYLNGAVTT